MTLTQEKIDSIKNQRQQMKNMESDLNFFKGMVIQKITYERFNDPFVEGLTKFMIVIHLNSPIVKLKKDIQFYIMSDDEGNDIGSIHTNIKEYEVIPTF